MLLYESINDLVIADPVPPSLAREGQQPGYGHEIYFPLEDFNERMEHP